MDASVFRTRIWDVMSEDRVTGRVIGMAPNYDNNFAFLGELDHAPFLAAAKGHGWTLPGADSAGSSNGRGCVNHTGSANAVGSALDAVSETIREISAFAAYDPDRLLGLVRERMAAIASALEAAR